MATLDVEAVVAFVTIADMQSFSRAADALGTTQGAISVKLKRLEDNVGKRLIERTPRHVRLSAQGATFLESAREFLAAHDRALEGLRSVRRKFRLGISTQVGSLEVPAMLARLNAYDPSITVELRLSDSRDLLDVFDRGEIDAAIIDREDDRRDADVLGTQHFGWFATPHFVYRKGEPLRLASSSPSCRIRNVGTRALDDAGISWSEVILGCGSFAVVEAVAAGLAASILPHSLAPAGTIEVSQKFGLPSVQSSEIVLLSALSDRKSREVVNALAEAFREHRFAASDDKVVKALRLEQAS
jgi:DNA-binding transcriptional LysR family regulator